MELPMSFLDWLVLQLPSLALITILVIGVFMTFVIIGGTLKEDIDDE